MSGQSREIIDRFAGPYAFLSNFHPCRVTFYGLSFPSVEAAFQAAKCANAQDRAQFQDTIMLVWVQYACAHPDGVRC